MINAPLFLCFFFIAGIILGHFHSPVNLLAQFSTLIVFCRFKKFSFILFIIFFAAGQIVIDAAWRNADTDIKRFSSFNKSEIQGGGHVIEPVRVKGDKTFILVKSDRFEPAKINDSFNIEIEVAGKNKLSTGDYLTFEGIFVSVKSNDEYRISRHVKGRVIASKVKDKNATSNIYKLSQTVNRQIDRIGEKYIGKEHRALFSGMLVGDVSLMDPEQTENFKRSGLTHLVAVSGSNLAMIAVPLLIALTWLGISRSARIVIIAAVIVFYATATGLQAPVLRASIMTLLAFYSIFFVGQKRGLALLSTACVALLAWDPFLLRSPGFLFSFTSTLGLIITLKRFEIFFGFMPAALSLPLASTLAAQILVIPVSVYYFGQISIASLAANVLAAPFVPLITNAGLIALILYNIAPAITFLPALAGDLFLSLLVKISEVFGNFSWAMIDLNFSYALLFIYLLAIAFFISTKVTSGRKIKTVIALALVTAVLVSWQPVLSPARPEHDLEIYFLDVGQADSALVRTKDGINILIDTGRGDGSALKYLGSIGVRKIDLLVISHFEEDHCGGSLDILRKYKVHTVMAPEVAEPGAYEKRTFKFLRENNIPVIKARKNDEWRLGSLQLNILSPAPDQAFEDLNNSSLVLRLRFGAKSFLFTGDIEQGVQDILERDKSIKSDVIKVPHHGAADAADEEFLKTVDPSLAVISAGRNNPYGHPSAKYLSLLNKRAVSIRRTDKDGNVKIASDGKTISFIEGGNRLANLKLF